MAWCGVLLLGHLGGAQAQSPSQAIPGTDPLLTRIMQGLSAVHERRATFTEDRTVGVLTVPLHSTGTLLYHAPGHLEKHQLTPKPDTLVIDGHFLIIMRDATTVTQTLDMNNHPELRLLADGLRAPLSGNLADLQRTFLVASSGDLSHWQLLLTPRAENGKLVKTIQVSGEGDAIKQIFVTQPNGDTDRTVISP